MANHLMKYKGSRGSEYRRYIGKVECEKCGCVGYMEEWYTQLNSFIFTVVHRIGRKTVSRCWI